MNPARCLNDTNGELFINEPTARQQATARVRDARAHGKLHARGEGTLPLAVCGEPFDEGAGAGRGLSPFGQDGQKSFADPGRRTVASSCPQDFVGDEGSSRVVATKRRM